MHVTTSLEVLRERGPMRLDDLCGETSKRLGSTMRYRDVEETMLRHRDAMQATCSDDEDYRAVVWTAVDA